ncbi:putative cation/H+ exchanger, CPA1 family [Helianthus annuus]|nr:putative cation/H+ exchanger, CPA1 family [Helianthus annuus]
MEPIHNSTFYSVAAATNLQSTHSDVISITLFIAVLCLCLVVGHLLETYRWLNESIAAILIVTFLYFFFFFFIFYYN